MRMAWSPVDSLIEEPFSLYRGISYAFAQIDLLPIWTHQVVISDAENIEIWPQIFLIHFHFF